MKRIALITGSSRGIGKQISQSLKENFELITPNRNELDLSSESSIDNFLGSLNQPVDVLINNAGIQKIGLVENLSMKDFQEILQINLIAPFRLATGISTGMKDRKYGRILNISSIWGSVSKEGRAIYAASKSGLNSITRSLALEFAPYNILVNALAPGYVETDMTLRNNSDVELEKIKEIIPLKRLATPEEIVECIKFLCSDKNSYLTGHVLVVDGGYLCK